jgi:uncharacterized UPF0160 family protein
MKTVAVHNKYFHADDVFAIAILRLIYPALKVIRTRDEKELKLVDARIDVGGNYDPSKNDFDHHQTGGAGKRQNNIPYASAGLIWKHFGKRLVSSGDVFNHIDEKIIQYVDADDVGVDTYTPKKVSPYTIADFVHGLNPQWPNQSEELFNKYFEEAVLIITNLLKKEIEAAERSIQARDIIREEIKKSNGKYLLLKKYIPWREIVIKESKLKYVLYYNSIEDYWCVFAVPISINTFENRKSLPQEWGGLVEKDLQRVTGVKDAKFCHNNLFIVTAGSKEGAIKLVELALKNKPSRTKQNKFHTR